MVDANEDGEVIFPDPNNEEHVCAEGYWRRRCQVAERKLDSTLKEVWVLKAKLRDMGVKVE